MIIPVTPESTWRAQLDTLPHWQPPDRPTLIVAPHPDDETLASGGLIAALCRRGTPVTVIAVTDGEHSYADIPDLARLREAEQTAALARLGLSAEHIVRLHLKDGDVAASESQLCTALLAHVASGSHIVAPWSHDFHPDHEACGRSAHAVASRTGAALTSWFFWTWHHGTPELLRDLPLTSFQLDSVNRTAKEAALACHRSQLEHAAGDPVLPEDLLHPARRPYEVFLPA